MLDQRLKYLGVSVEDSRTTIAGTTTTPLEEGRDYEASFDEATRTLEVKIKNPSAHPDVRVTIKTEVVGSVDGIGNSVDVFVDGQYKGGDKTEVKDDLVAVTAYGSVVSAKAPTWAASALKLVDGGQGETPAGAFTFSLVQVDESGNPIEGGQSAEAVNGADGAISFDAITYGLRNIAGTYWYQITEKSTDELAAIYKMDDSVKTVKVTLQKGADGDYLLSCEVVDGGDGAAADSVVFNNETIPEVPDNPDKPGNPDTPDTSGNPDKPDTPEVPDSPDAPQAPEAPGDENVLSKTGDGAPTVSSARARSRRFGIGGNRSMPAQAVKPPCFLMKNPCNALARSHEFWYHSIGCAKDGAIGNKCDDTRRRCICALRSLATATLQSYRMQLFRIRRSECTQS